MDFLEAFLGQDGGEIRRVGIVDVICIGGDGIERAIVSGGARESALASLSVIGVDLPAAIAPVSAVVAAIFALLPTALPVTG